MSFISTASEIVGGQSALAKELAKEYPSDKITQQKVWNWIHRFNRTPAKYIEAVSKITKKHGNEITVFQLLSDHQEAA